MEPKSTLLILSQESPESFSPTGERVKHTALAASSIFERVIILSSRAKSQSKKGSCSRTYLYTISLSVRLPFPLSAYFDPIKFVLFFAQSLVLSIRHKPQVVLATMPPLEIGVTSWLLARLFRTKLITDLNDDWESSFELYLKRYIPRILMRLLFKLASRIYSSSSCIFVVTPTLAKTVRQRGINSPLVLAPNGADTSIFRPQSASVRKRTRSMLSLPENKIVVAYTGSSIDPYYRLDLVLSSIRSLSANKEVPFFFVFYLINGIEALRKLRDQTGVSKELVDIREPLPRDKLSVVLASCDVGLVPFDDESFLLYAMSSKVYEYLSAGLYVVSTGPKSGELDKFFSQNESLGLFASPKAKDLVLAFSHMIKTAGGLFDDSSRNSRHLFIKKYYDRHKTMMEAMARARCLVQR